MVPLTAEARRSDPVQQPPPDDLTDFPKYKPDNREFLYREHAARDGSPDFGCWYFSGHKEGEEPGGRFDLTLPNGTCYLAESELAAASERCGRFLASGMPIPPHMYAGRVVTKVNLPETIALIADATTSDASKHHQVTRELFSGNNHALTAQWADALHHAGCTGIAYEPRFSVGAGRALGVFGDAGPRPEAPIVESRRLADVLAESNVRYDKVPAASEAQPEDTAEVEDAPDD